VVFLGKAGGGKEGVEPVSTERNFREGSSGRKRPNWKKEKDVGGGEGGRNGSADKLI